MKKTWLVSLVVVGLFFLVWGCDSSESLTDSGLVKIQMKAKNGISSRSLSAGRVAPDSVVFSQAYLGISKLKFEKLEDERYDDDDSDFGDTDNDSDSCSNHEDDDDNKVKFEGSFIFDLITGTSTPSFEVPPGQYKEIKVETAPILPNNKSALIAFDVTNGAQTFKVEFSMSTKLELEIEKHDGFNLDGGTLTEILVLLKLDALIAGIDFRQAVVDADGVIRVNETSNITLFKMIKSNLRESFETGEDHDHDGEIDD